jgi:predicted HTH transcriptional regulator
LDFKEKWLPFPQMARHILGISNAGGGCIIVGVAEMDDKTLEANGIEALLDKAKVVDGIKKFLPNVLLEEVELGDFAYDASEYPKLVSKKFQVIFISSDSKRLPYISMAESDGIRNNAIYTRRGTTTVEVNYEELQGIINQRLETGYSSQSEIDLQAHMEHLKMLYGQVSKYHVRVSGGFYEKLQAFSENIDGMMGTREQIANPMYPEEDFEKFIIKMIEKKKRRIEALLDLANL